MYYFSITALLCENYAFTWRCSDRVGHVELVRRRINARSGRVFNWSLQRVRLDPDSVVTSHPYWLCIFYFCVKDQSTKMLPLYFFLPHRWWNITSLRVFFLLDLKALFHLENYNKGGISWAGTDSSPWTSHMLIHMCLLAAWTANVCVLCWLNVDLGGEKKKKILVWFGRRSSVSRES